MSQNPGKGKLKWQWIQLRKQIRPNDWKHNEVVRMNGKEWGFQTKIEFEPKLNKENKAWCWGCTYFHKNITLDIFMSMSDKTDSADLRVCYIPKSTTERNTFMVAFDKMLPGLGNDGSSYRKNYHSYVWIFDICLVKMVLKNLSSENTGITKYFHVDPGSRNCKIEDHLTSSADEFAHFQRSEFLSKAELEEIGFNIKSGNRSFISADIEFTARLHLVPVPQDMEIQECNDNCMLDVPQMQLFQSDKMSISPGILFSLKPTELKLAALDVAPDVTFEIMSAPFTTTMRAHSLILSAQSSVFSRMLSTDMLEKKTGTIKLEDGTSPESLKLFLTYLYERMNLSYSSDADASVDHSPDDSGPAHYRSLDEWTAEFTLKIMTLAHKYQVQDLTHLCMENIISRPDSEITSELAFQIFEAGVLYSSDDLQHRSVEWTKRQAQEVKKELRELLWKKRNVASSAQFLLRFL